MAWLWGGLVQRDSEPGARRRTPAEGISGVVPDSALDPAGPIHGGDRCIGVELKCAVDPVDDAGHG